MVSSQAASTRRRASAALIVSGGGSTASFTCMKIWRLNRYMGSGSRLGHRCVCAATWCRPQRGRRALGVALAPRSETVHADPATYIAPGTPEAAVRAAGAAIAAVEAALAGDIAIAAMRPPGHHCLPDRPMGFCVLANIAIAVRHAQAL